MLAGFRSKATNYLPHIKLPVPYRLAPHRRLNVYIDCELGHPLNFREPSVQKFLYKNIANYNMFYDVGAHIGTHTVLSSHQGENIDIHSFEPHPENADRLRENIDLNGISDYTSVAEKAVSDVDGSVKLNVGSSEAHSVTDIYENTEQLPVSSTTLNNYASSHNTPGLIKVDVEGAGGVLLKGATSLLNSQTDWIVETHNQSERDAFHTIFESEGYLLHRLNHNHFFATIE